jgi:hypothetical protein
VNIIGDDFAPLVSRWLSAVSTPPVKIITHQMPVFRGEPEQWMETRSGHSDRNVGILKGLAWTCAGRKELEVARALAKMALAGLTKTPNVGAWGIRASSAAIYALGESPENPEAVAALAGLKSRIIHRPTLLMIERTLQTVAKRQGVTKDDLEDPVRTDLRPGHGRRPARTVRRDGERVRRGDARRDTGDVSLSYFAPDGKPLKAAPTAVKTGENAERFKSLKADADAAGKTLTAQKVRFDGFYLQQRTWKYADFVSRFVEHPLLSQLANRLVWHFARPDGTKTEGIYDAATGGFADVRGEPIPDLTPDTTVSLWHPIGFAPEYVVAWREGLAALGVIQPFKQAHREVYLLTDAELATGTYSNRFAGHLLKQHQMNALAKGRGWSVALQGGWDGAGSDAARRDLPEWDLRVEYFIDIAGDEYSDSGISTYVSTDQVRFFRGTGEQSLPLSEVPALAFSEILRDVDLFVGVASVGNDPSWADTGANRNDFDAYWHSYSFGDLSASAETRGRCWRSYCPAQDREPLRTVRAISAGARRSADVQDSPRLGEHSDGAERPVPVHRAGARQGSYGH